MKRRLVVYFSASEYTKNVSLKLANLLNASLYEITPKVPYTKEDLDWHNMNSRSSIEMKDEKSRPEIINNNLKINDYDTIYLGYPIWWGTAPTIVNTFLESYDFTGKNIITFATSGGSGMGESTTKLKISAKGATFVEGTILNINNVDKFVIDMNK